MRGILERVAWAVVLALPLAGLTLLRLQPPLDRMWQHVAERMPLAAALNVTGESPGGQLSPFCEQLNAASIWRL